MRRVVLFVSLAFIYTIHAQALPLKQSFEQTAADNWNYTTNPAAYNSGGDVWDRVDDGGQYFNPAPDGDFFWEFYDIDEIPGIPDDKVAHLDFETVDLSGEGMCTLSFHYCNRGLDSADYMSYTIMLDNSNNWESANEVLLPKHSADPAEWQTVNIVIPAQAQYCRLRFSAKANSSADCGGFDNIVLKAGDLFIPELAVVTPTDGSFYENPTTAITLTGTATNIFGMICWSNALNAVHGEIAATSAWSIADVFLDEGRNRITVSATNVNGLTAADTVQIDRARGFPTGQAGAIAFTAFSSAGDSFSFVLLRDIPAGTVIRFTDEEWDGVDFGTGEDDLTWSNTLATAAGTVIEIYNCDSTADISNNIGTVSGKLVLAQSADGIIAYYGDAQRDPTAFLAAVSTAAENLDGTGLSYGESAVDIANSPTSQYYSGVREGEAEWSDYLPLINDAANWSATGGAIPGWGDATPFTKKKACTVMTLR